MVLLHGWRLLLGEEPVCALHAACTHVGSERAALHVHRHCGAAGLQGWDALWRVGNTIIIMGVTLWGH